MKPSIELASNVVLSQLLVAIAMLAIFRLGLSGVESFMVLFLASGLGFLVVTESASEVRRRR